MKTLMLCTVALVLAGCDDSRATPVAPPTQTDGGCCWDHNLAHDAVRAVPEIDAHDMVAALTLTAGICLIIKSRRNG